MDFLDKVKKEISSTVAVDFDGVIHKNTKGFHDGTIYDDPIKGTKKALKELSKKYTLIIYTCKANPERPLINNKTGTELIKEWLDKHGLSCYIKRITHEKPRASFYIDDKGITFKNWDQTLNDISLLCDKTNGDITKF